MESKVWLVIVRGDNDESRTIFDTLEEAKAAYEGWTSKGFTVLWFECTELPIP